MSEKKNPLGPTGEAVRANVRRLRGGLQYKELAQMLEDVGRPIPTLGLRRIEVGERRVDADDLMALAVVFNVSPLTLLLPADGSNTLASKMTGVPDREVAHNVQWLYAQGQEPLTLPNMGHGSEADRQKVVFRLRSVPQIELRAAGVSKTIGDEEEPGEDGMHGLAAELRRRTSAQGFGLENESVSGHGNY